MSITDYPENIILDPGESVEGRFLGLERGHSKYGERAIAILDVDGVERSLWLNETALRGQVREKQPGEGECIIVAKGSEKVTPKSGNNPYWPFRITTPDRPSDVGFNDALLNPDEDGPEPDTTALARFRTQEDVKPSGGLKPKADDGDIPFGPSVY